MLLRKILMAIAVSSITGAAFALGPLLPMQKISKVSDSGSGGKLVCPPLYQVEVDPSRLCQCVEVGVTVDKTTHQSTTDPTQCFSYSYVGNATNGTPVYFTCGSTPSNTDLCDMARYAAGGWSSTPEGYWFDQATCDANIPGARLDGVCQ